MPSAGRKFLLAVRGGLNLTHSEDLDRFLTRYGAAKPHLRFGDRGVSRRRRCGLGARAWGRTRSLDRAAACSRNRSRLSPLLRAFLRRLRDGGVEFKLRHHWIGWDERGDALFDAPEGRRAFHADAVVLALGGASWPRLGSDGGWTDVLAKAGIAVTPLQPANCGFIAHWSDVFRERFQGQPLKRIELSFGGQAVRARPLSPGRASKAAASMRCRRICARPSRRPAKRC